MTSAASIRAVTDMTDAVQAAIDGGDWRRAAELESERRRALAALVEQASAGDGAGAAVAKLLDDARAHVERQIGEVRHHQRRIEREAATVRTGRAAARAYASARDGS